MSEGPERACLAIADVSGYTGYLAGVELDHAQDILADLVGTVVTGMAPFELSKLEGDAAFMSLPGEALDGSLLQDTIEGTYIAFQRRLRDIKQASSCECDACVRIPSLDLKFVVHHGAVARQRMVGLEELVGPDVILVHRLLKNDVQTEHGLAAYAIYTDAVVVVAGIDPNEQGLLRHVEQTDVAGEVTTWLRDLSERWRSELERPPRDLSGDELLDELVWEVPTPPSVTFEWLTSPSKRVLWDPTITSFDEEVVDGRRGAGTTNHCMHGDDAVLEEVVEWRPPGYWLVKGFITSIEGEKPGIYIGDRLDELPGGGTRVTSRTGRLEDDTTEPELFRELLSVYLADHREHVDRLRGLLIDEAAATKPTVEVPPSAGRHLSQPLVSS